MRKWKTGHTVAAMIVGAVALFGWQQYAGKRANAKRS